ncbi:hypothetical protein GSI_12457 [Ganoderma sinense ZZ0214-1]|uniref:Fungal-type protein kinase domain-containing protein n=1 Tax=Ganoderma sinense ZZ0214-1 TaxID=1077348 RepID=A0A2G8RSU9_9APHY|nr:hypothetical protein GSI_12457 [Ganoderma sinense ZZ0214-1]
MADANTPPPSPPPADPQGTSTVPNPPATPARTDTGFPQHHPHPFNSTPLKPSQNRWFVDPEAGKARRISLVDDTGMGTRFHQLGLNTFNSIIPGDVPSNEVREQFVAPEIQKKMSEHDIGVQLTKTIKSVLDAAGVDHGLEALLTPYHKSRGDHGNPEDTCNDIGIYPTTEMAQRVTHFIRRDITRSRHKKELEEGSFGRRSWYWMAVLGEVKSENNRTCAFNMVPIALLPPDAAEAADPYITGNDQGEEGLGQLAEYMHNVLTHQHRCFAYGFYVQWKYARLLYFDRTGALLSEAFDWSEPTSLLHDFVWKVAHMTSEQLGYDSTAQVVSESDLDLLRSKMVPDELETLPTEVRQYVLNAFDCTATRPPKTTDAEDSTTKAKKATKAKAEVPLDEIPIFKLTVTSSDPSPDEAFPNSPTPSVPSTTASTGDGDATPERDFLVGRPYFAAGSLTGRCTRGYIAFDVEEKTFCFLKDSWRPLFPGRSRPEHLVYERLRSHKVSDIASLVCGGDVGGHRAQVTRIQDYMPPERKPVPRVHYRIVVKEIGLPLTEFKNFTELAGVFGDALGAHLAAYALAGILHRDISVGNILINPETRSGFLIDWDLSRLVSELEQGPMEPDRTGTWQFRSALSLLYLRKPYRLSDDIESFVHAFQYMVLRFHRTGVIGLRTHVQTYFEHSAKAGPFRIGGQWKLSLFRSPQAPFKVVENDQLQALLNEIARRCHHEFYKFVDEDLMERKYGVGAGVARALSPQTEQAPPPPHRQPTENNLAMMAMFQHLDIFPSDLDTSFPKRDACDIQSGVLSHQFHLMKIFNSFTGAAQDKHEDQFIARAADEPAKPAHRVPACGIAKMSGSRTQDDSSQPNSITMPLYTAPSPVAAPLSPPPPSIPSGSVSASTDDPSPALSSGMRTLGNRQPDVPYSGQVASIAPPSTAAAPPPVSESSPALSSPMASVSEDTPEPGPAPPSSNAQSRHKRKQQDVRAGNVGTAADNNGATSGGPGLSPSKQEPKRPRKGRS